MKTRNILFVFNIALIAFIAGGLAFVFYASPVFNYMSTWLLLLGLIPLSGMFFSFRKLWKKYHQSESTIEGLKNIYDEMSVFLSQNQSLINEVKARAFNLKITDIAPGMIAVFNVHKARYMYVNKAVEKMFGHKVEELIEGGFSLVDTLIHPDDIMEVRQKYLEILTNAPDISLNGSEKNIPEFEFRFRHRNGNYKWVHSYGIVFSRSGDQKVEQLIFFSFDITDRKEMEENLKNAKFDLERLNNQLEKKVSERTLELEHEKKELKKQSGLNYFVLKATRDVVWDWNLITNEITWNENYELLFGYKYDQVFNQIESWFGRIKEEDKERVISSIRECIQSDQELWYNEYLFKKADGTFAYIYDRGYVIRDEKGKPYRMVGCMTDMTRQKEAEIKTRNSELKFRTMFDSNMIGMVFSSFNGQIIDANDEYLRMLDLTRKDLRSGDVRWQQLTAREHAHLDTRAIEQLKANGFCPPYEKDYIKKDGTRLTVLVGSALLTEDQHADAVTYVIDITKRKAAENKVQQLLGIIKKQEAEFRSILMRAPAMISIRRGPELKMEFENRAVVDFLRKQDTIGESLMESKNRFSGDELANAMIQVYKTGKPFLGKAFHIQYKKEDTGEFIDKWIDFIFEPVYSADGNIDGVATFGFDVTNLIKANREIKENENRYKFLADAMPQKVWTATPDGGINYFNKVWLDYTNYDFDELKGFGWHRILHPDDLKRTLVTWLKAKIWGKDIEVEHRFLRKDGTYRWHLSRAIAEKDETGKVVLWVGTNTDIDDQKKVSEALKISEDHFRQLADQSPFMIWKVDENALCNYVNQSWIDFTGLSYTQSMSKGWSVAFHPDDRVGEYEKFLDAFHRRGNYSSKFRLKKNTGEYRWVLAQSTPLNTNRFEGYIGSLTDITEQELAQQAMNLLSQKKDEFMSVASHELKTPITSMKSYLQIVERLTKDDEACNQIYPFIEKANRQVDKLTSLVEDLLDVTKIQSGKMEFSKSYFNIHAALRDCVDQIQLNTKTHTLEVYCSDQNTIVYADKHRLEQVMINFISNAIKYSPGESKVIIKCINEKGILTFSVIDFGIGIPEEKIQFLFTRFFRVEEISRNFSGLGLGLYISSEIIKRHGGKIGVNSEAGKGSEFWFQLSSNLQIENN